jgi:hypothetical protein
MKNKSTWAETFLIAAWVVLVFDAYYLNNCSTRLDALEAEQERQADQIRMISEIQAMQARQDQWQRRHIIPDPGPLPDSSLIKEANP